jgi:hypothetical protein
MSTVGCSRGIATPYLNIFSGSELKNCIDNQETQSLNSFRLCPVYVDDPPPSPVLNHARSGVRAPGASPIPNAPARGIVNAPILAG